MNNHKILAGKYNNGKEIKDCLGKIKILKIDDEHKVGYASWQIFDENKIGIAAITRSYYFGEANNPQEEILKMILIDIQKYRINRQKVFLEIKVK